jgi:hypothetical protein
MAIAKTAHHSIWEHRQSNIDNMQEQKKHAGNMRKTCGKHAQNM